MLEFRLGLALRDVDEIAVIPYFQDLDYTVIESRSYTLGTSPHRSGIAITMLGTWFHFCRTEVEASAQMTSGVGTYRSVDDEMHFFGVNLRWRLLPSPDTQSMGPIPVTANNKTVCSLG